MERGRQTEEEKEVEDGAENGRSERRKSEKVRRLTDRKRKFFQRRKSSTEPQKQKSRRSVSILQPVSPSHFFPSLAPTGDSSLVPPLLRALANPTSFLPPSVLRCHSTSQASISFFSDLTPLCFLFFSSFQSTEKGLRLCVQ